MRSDFSLNTYNSLSSQPMIPPKRYDISPPLTGGYSEGLDAFTFFFKQDNFCDNLGLVVAVFTLKTVLTSIQYLLFLTLQGKETNLRGHKLTQIRYRESPNTCENM